MQKFTLIFLLIIILSRKGKICTVYLVKREDSFLDLFDPISIELLIVEIIIF